MKIKATAPCLLCQFCEASTRGRAPSRYSYQSCHTPFPLSCVLLPEVPESLSGQSPPADTIQHHSQVRLDLPGPSSFLHGFPTCSFIQLLDFYIR